MLKRYRAGVRPRQTSWLGKMIFMLLVVALILIGASANYRLSKGKGFSMPRLSDAFFHETWRSGSSDRRFRLGLALAPRILWIVVTKDRLLVGPHLPFNLAFGAEFFGWDHNVPESGLLDVRQADDGSVTIRYRHLTGDEENLQLYVRNPQALLAALAKIRAG